MDGNMPRAGEFVRHGYPECPGKATLPETPARCNHLRSLIQTSIAGSAGFEVGVLPSIIHGYGSKYGVDGVEGQPCCRFAQIDADHFDAGKCEALHIGSQLDRIADRNDRLRQLARRGVERKIGSTRATSETTSTTASIALTYRAKDAVSIGFTQSSYVNQHNKMPEQ